MTTGMPTAGPAGLIDLDTAASRSGKSVGHLKRLCQDWARSGLAVQQRPPEGGKARWYVRDTADAAFARVKFPEGLTADLRAIAPDKLKEATVRRSILQRWYTARKAAIDLGYTADAGTGRFLQQLHLDDSVEVSRATLYLWEARWRREGLVGLVDGRSGKKANAAEAPADPFLDEVKRLYLDKRKRTIKRCFHYACVRAEENGWPISSYKKCQRFLDAIPMAVKLKFREGEKAYTDEAEPFIERDYSTLVSNEEWVGDHHQFDVIVSHQGKLVRPWLTVWQDMRSRKIVGWHVFAHDPNQDTILYAFRHGVGENGVPQNVYVDNGKDYDCFALNGRTKKDRWTRRKLQGGLDYEQEYISGLFGELGVGVTHCEPYHGQSKPVERFFGTMESQFGRNFKTYCGKSPADKPDDLQLHLERGEAPTLRAFIEAFDAYVIHDYNRAAHQGNAMEGKSPDRVFAEQMDVKRTARPELLDLLMLKKTQPVKVTQNGVMLDGLRYGQYEPALHELLGQDVYLRYDPRQLGSVQVWSEKKFICIATSNRAVPANADSQMLRDAKRQKGQHRKLVKQYIEQRPRMSEDLNETMYRAAIERNQKEAIEAGETPPPGPTIQPVRSALEDQLPRLQRAMERMSNRRTLRPAVGGESIGGEVDSISFADLASRMRRSDGGDEDNSGGDTFGRLAEAVRRRTD